MRTLATDTLNDLTLTVAAGLDAVMQSCQQAAQAQAGEMVFSKNTGMPNFQTIWQKGRPAAAVWESKLRATLAGVGGVLSIPSITVEAIDGVLRYNATIKTRYGEAAING